MLDVKRRKDRFEIINKKIKVNAQKNGQIMQIIHKAGNKVSFLANPSLARPSF